jgi:hypothetical protein
VYIERGARWQSVGYQRLQWRAKQAALWSTILGSHTICLVWSAAHEGDKPWPAIGWWIHETVPPRVIAVAPPLRPEQNEFLNVAVPIHGDLQTEHNPSWPPETAQGYTLMAAVLARDAGGDAGYYVPVRRDEKEGVARV